MKTSIDLTVCYNGLSYISKVPLYFSPENYQHQVLIDDAIDASKKAGSSFHFLSLFRHLEKPERSASHFPSSAASKDCQPSSNATPIAPVKGMKKMAPAGEI